MRFLAGNIAQLCNQLIFHNSFPLEPLASAYACLCFVGGESKKVKVKPRHLERGLGSLESKKSRSARVLRRSVQ